jgi:hypothetical protein
VLSKIFFEFGKLWRLPAGKTHSQAGLMAWMRSGAPYSFPKLYPMARKGLRGPIAHR